MFHVLLVLRSRVNAGLETDCKGRVEKGGFLFWIFLVRLPSVMILFFSLICLICFDFFFFGGKRIFYFITELTQILKSFHSEKLTTYMPATTLDTGNISPYAPPTPPTKNTVFKKFHSFPITNLLTDTRMHFLNWGDDKLAFTNQICRKDLFSKWS